MSHFGEISADRVYHINALTSIMQYKDVRTAYKELDDLGVSYVKRGKNTYIPGSEFIRAIEKQSTPGGEEEAE